MKKILTKWYLYLLAIVLSVVSFCMITVFKTSPSATEKINFFLGTYDAQISKLDDALEAKKSGSIKQINITFCFYGSSSFDYVFQTTRTEMDFYILPSTFLKNNEGLYKYFPELDTSYLDEYFETTLEYIELEEKTKGIKVYDHNTKEGFFKDYVSYDAKDSEEDFFLLYNYNSENIGKINKKSSTENALYITKTLFNI